MFTHQRSQIVIGYLVNDELIGRAPDCVGRQMRLAAVAGPKLATMLMESRDKPRRGTGQFAASNADCGGGLGTAEPGKKNIPGQEVGVRG